MRRVILLSTLQSCDETMFVPGRRHPSLSSGTSRARPFRPAEAARREAERTRAVSEFLFDLFAGADPETNPGEALTVLDLLDSGAQKVAALEAGPRAKSDLLRILGTLYGKLGEAEKGESFLRSAVAEATSGLGHQSRTSRESRVALAEHLALVGDPQEAEAILEDLLEAGAGEHTAAAHESIGVALRKRGRYEEAEWHHIPATEYRSRTTK